MQFAVAARRSRAQLDFIATSIAFGLLLVKASGGMQGLMHIAHEMEEPHQIIGFHVHRGMWVFEYRAERDDLRLSIGNVWITKTGAIGRERDINVMPVPMHELVGVADVTCCIRTVGTLAIIDIVQSLIGFDRSGQVAARIKATLRLSCA